MSIETIDFRGLRAIKLRALDGSTAVITHHGAHVVSWITAEGDERLYLSDRSSFTEGKAIRGGIPIIFPQFSTFGSLPRHGFARTTSWSSQAEHRGEDFVGATFALSDTPDSQAIWPHAFRTEFTVSLSRNRLDVELDVENQGTTSFEFTAALHTYLRVEHIETTQLMGLLGCFYRDQLRNKVEHADKHQALSFSEEIDRIYLHAPREMMLREPRRSLNIESIHFPDIVVWNPWVEKCSQLSDMPRDGYKRMLCVESAVIEHPVKLDPGNDWWGRQSLIAIR